MNVPLRVGVNAATNESPGAIIGAGVDYLRNRNDRVVDARERQGRHSIRGVADRRGDGGRGVIDWVAEEELGHLTDLLSRVRRSQVDARVPEHCGLHCARR